MKLKFVKFSLTFHRDFSLASRNLPWKRAYCSADSSAYCELCDCVKLGV